MQSVAKLDQSSQTSPKISTGTNMLRNKTGNFLGSTIKWAVVFTKLSSVLCSAETSTYYDAMSTLENSSNLNEQPILNTDSDSIGIIENPAFDLSDQLKLTEYNTETENNNAASLIDISDRISSSDAYSEDFDCLSEKVFYIINLDDESEVEIPRVIYFTPDSSINPLDIYRKMMDKHDFNSLKWHINKINKLDRTIFLIKYVYEIVKLSNESSLSNQENASVINENLLEQRKLARSHLDDIIFKYISKNCFFDISSFLAK